MSVEADVMIFCPNTFLYVKKKFPRFVFNDHAVSLYLGFFYETYLCLTALTFQCLHTYETLVPMYQQRSK